jgi:hypothetical protein
VLDRRGPILLLAQLHRARLAPAQVVDRAVLADPEEVLLEGEGRVELVDPAHRAEQRFLHHVLGRLVVARAPVRVGEQRPQ